ncbi:epoxide hydrolase 3-like isoform X1 [Rhipicephalus sanguineus]|uniref:epoxide hydrolase 3-like isoform X1 n=1 Tax=Rhipicephalus sanguineus TaxID=34632 RepID=UPI001893C061|nr:epoxide hydrolase 3-like isoform X1 [Rhipicephalus sanguineus]
MNAFRHLQKTMMPPALGKLIFIAIGTTMWIWMQAYVKVQVTLYGESILKPHNRTVPADLTNSTYGSHETVDLNSITVHYVKKGCASENSGKPMLLLLHGFLDFWYIWNHQIDVLGQQFCVIAPDLRGYGNTTKPENTTTYLMKNLVEDLKLLIEELNKTEKRKVFLVGHDWGAMIGFVFATLHEKMIEGLVIVNGMHPMAFARRLLESITQMKMSWYFLPFRHENVPEKYLEMWDFSFFDKIHKGFTFGEEEAHKYVFSQKDALTGALNYYRAFNDDNDQLKKFDYRQINVTTLILWGEQDAFLTTPIARYNQVYLRKSSVVYYPGAGHWLLRECYNEVTEQIRNFVNTTSAVRTHTFTGKTYQRSSNDLCRHSSSPLKSWISRALAWLPQNVSIPKLTAE